MTEFCKLLNIVVQNYLLKTPVQNYLVFAVMAQCPNGDQYVLLLSALLTILTRIRYRDDQDSRLEKLLCI